MFLTAGKNNKLNQQKLLKKNSFSTTRVNTKKFS